MNFIIEHWEALSSLLLSIVAVGIAIYSSHKTSKDATRQIESIKQLAKLQIETTKRQVEVEIVKNQMLIKQAKQEADGINEINNSGLAHIGDYKDMVMGRFKEGKAEREYNIYREFERGLKAILDNLNGIEL